VISGKVQKQVNDKTEPQSGLRVYLKSKDGDFEKEMRTFSDGAFYSYKIPPGSYHLFIDRNQLEFLDVNSEPDTMQVEVKALAEGDFVEGLNFTLTPKSTTEPTAADTVSSKSTADTTYISDQQLYYKIQIASFRTLTKAKKVATLAASRLKGSFSVIFNTNTNLYAIRSFPIANRDQALKNILSYRDNDFERAALVILDSQNIKPDDPQSGFIKLGEFENKDAADRFSEQSSNDLNVETAVSFNKDNEQYLVYVDKRYYSRAEIESQLATIQANPSYKEASLENIQNYSLYLGEKEKRAMEFSFQIRVEDPKNNLDEKRLQSLTNPRSGAKLNRSSNGIIIFDGLTSWTRAKELHQKLANIPTIKYPTIVLIEK
jgi:hypothetical protein